MKYNNKSSQSGLILYGRHAVLSALANPERQKQKVLCTADLADEIKAACKKNDINENIIHIVDRREIDRVVSHDAVHQGVILYTKELPSYAVEEIIALADEKENCYVLVLDQVTDPQNIGAIIRSCAAFGCLALIIQDKNSPKETGAMAKAAAGTMEILPICRTTNLSRAIGDLKNAGFWAIGLDGKGKENIDQTSKLGKHIIVMGSEGKGMRRLVEENCDIVVRLPISPKVESLNVATAAAITMYEMSK